MERKELNVIPRTVSKEGRVNIEICDDSLGLSSERDLNPANVSHIEILEEPKNIDSSEGIENELLVSKSARTIFNVDINGHLIVSDNFAANFSINDNAELIYER